MENHSIGDWFIKIQIGPVVATIPSFSHNIARCEIVSRNN
jgi:hypothetical protein